MNAYAALNKINDTPHQRLRSSTLNESLSLAQTASLAFIATYMAVTYL